MRILLTGGHAATPALAVAEQIRMSHPDWKLFWIGPASAMEGQRVATAAEKTLADSGVEVLTIMAGRFKKRGNLLDIVRAYIKIPVGFVHALFLVGSAAPDLVVSFGGFAAFPVVVAAWLFGRPVIIHEQIVGAGLANRLSAPFARKIAVARSESLAFFPKSKTSLIGNPQVAEVFNIKKKTKIGNPPTIYITGGSSGSQIINESVDNVFEKLVSKYFVIHQTGDNNIAHFQGKRRELPGKLKDRYECFGYVVPSQVGKFFERADVVVSRSGANTVADIMTVRRPAVLIPIPWSIGDEQNKNALKASQTGLVSILKQDDLTGESLLSEIGRVIENWTRMAGSRTSSDFDLDKGAAKRMLTLIEGEI